MSPKELYYFRPEAAAGQELVQPNGNLSMDRRHHASGLLPDGKVIILAGCFSTSPSSEIFDPSTGTVAVGPNMAQSRLAPSGASLGGKFYVCGNFRDVAGGKQCEVYDPTLNNWQSTASAQFNHDLTDLGKQILSWKFTSVPCL